MKTFAFTLLALALLFFLLPGVFAQDGGKLGDEGTEDEDEGKLGDVEDEKEKEPFPATFAFRDYRLEMKTEDGRWWKHDKNYSKEETERNVQLKLRFKLPKSDDVFDAVINAQSLAHNLKITWKDGTEIKSNDPNRLLEKYFSDDLGPDWKKRKYEGGSWKGAKKKSVQPPKKIKKFCKGIKSGFQYQFVAQHPTANIPFRKTVTMFIYKDNTYILTMLMPTGATKNERVMKEVDALIKSLSVRKRKKR